MSDKRHLRHCRSDEEHIKSKRSIPLTIHSLFALGFPSTVLQKVRVRYESFSAFITSIRLLSSVEPLMDLQVLLVDKALSAFVAFGRLLTSVYAIVLA